MLIINGVDHTDLLKQCVELTVELLPDGTVEVRPPSQK